MIEKGTLVSVETREEGSSLTADVAAAATLLPVKQQADFTGTLLDVAGVSYAYTEVADAGIVLATGLTAPASEGDPVLSLNDKGEPEAVWVALVQLDEEDPQPIEATIDTNNRGYFRPGDADAGALTYVESDGDGYRVVSRPVDPALLDASVIDPTTPVPGGQTISDQPPPTDTTGYPEDYGWWQVDADGKVLGFWRLVGGVWTPATVVTEEALNANNILTTALTGKTITGTTIQTRATPDRGIKLGQVQGSTNYDEAFLVFNNSGVPFIKAVPDEELAVIAGEVKATTTTVVEGASLGGVTEITRGPVTAENPSGSVGALRLTAYTTAPKSAPTVTAGYDTVQFTDDGLWGNRYGWTTDGTYWYTVRGDSAFVLEKWTLAGTLVASSGQIGLLPTGVIHSGGFLYVLASGITSAYVVWKLDPATMALTASGPRVAQWAHADGPDAPAIGVDAATGDLLIAQSRPSNADKVRVRRYTWPAVEGDPLVAGASVDTDFAFANDLAGITYGTHDLGANRYIFASRTGSGSSQFRVTDSTGAGVGTEDWQSGMGAGKVGFTYTGGAFKSMDKNGLMRTYTGQDKTTSIGSGSLTKWVSNDLSTATAHTEQSPRAKVTISKRTKLNVTTSAINTTGTNAPDRVRIFVGQGSTDPGRTAMWKQTDPAVGVITTSYTSLATSGTNPVATNTFAGGTVQRFELANGTAFVDGIGDGSVGTGTFRDSVRSAVMGDYAAGAWTAYTPTFTATTTNPTLGNFTRVGRYTQRGKTVSFSAVITATAASGFGTGTYEFGLPVAARAVDEVVVQGIQNGPNRIYVGRMNTTTEFRLYQTSDFSAATNTTTAMASGTVVRISGTYEAA